MRAAFIELETKLRSGEISTREYCAAYNRLKGTNRTAIRNTTYVRHNGGSIVPVYIGF